MQLIIQRAGRYHVSLDTVREFESAILLDPGVTAATPPAGALASAAYYAWRLQHRLGSTVDVTSEALKFSGLAPRRYFAVSMGSHLRKCFPAMLLPGEKFIYFFDAWPDAHARIAHFCRVFDVRTAFFSASQAAQRIQALVPNTQCVWVPEGIDASDYSYRPYGDKTIDVLALGRNYQAHHDLIAAPLKAAGRQYLHEKIPGQIIFPERTDFLNGLARTKISVCVPASMTHPERAGGVETMTVRYLQSMASKCLILGHAPSEMISLFGYNPVIEIDMANAAAQVQWLLDNYASHVPLIERNFMAVRTLHSWQHRWARISTLLQSNAQPMANLADRQI